MESLHHLGEDCADDGHLGTLLVQETFPDKPFMEGKM